MKFKLPLLNHEYKVVELNTVRVRPEYFSRWWKNDKFFFEHSGQKLKTPNVGPHQFTIDQIYDTAVYQDDYGYDYIFLNIPNGCVIKITKMILSNNMGKHYVSLALTKSANRRTEWNLPSLYFSLPIEEFEELELEDIPCQK